MGIGILIALATSALIGVLAQRWKGRTGIAWSLLTLIVMAPVWMFFYVGTYKAVPEIYDTDAGFLALSLFIVPGVGILMAIVVATLPSRIAK